MEVVEVRWGCSDLPVPSGSLCSHLSHPEISPCRFTERSGVPYF